MKNRFHLITVAILSLGLLPGINAGAQDAPPAEPPAQPPASAQGQAPAAVGRLSVVHGTVSTMHGDSGNWMAGTVNTPLVPNDKVATA